MDSIFSGDEKSTDPFEDSPPHFNAPNGGIQHAITQRNSEFRCLPHIPLFFFLLVVLIEPGSLYALGERALTLPAH